MPKLSALLAKRTTRRPYESLRVLVGVLLLTAAALKGHQLATEPMGWKGEFGSRWTSILVVEFELLLGLCLLAGICRRLIWVVALGCFVVFAAVSCCRGILGHSSCGCFGRVHVNPWTTCGLDGAVILGLVCWRPVSSERATSAAQGIGPLMVVGLWVVLGAPAYVAMSKPVAKSIGDARDLSGPGRIALLEPETWVSKPFPLLSHIDIGEQLARGRWVVVLYDCHCRHCQALFPKLARLSHLSVASEVYQLAVVEMPGNGSASGRTLLASPCCVRARLKPSRDWFAETPVAIMLSDGVVLAVRVRERIAPLLLDENERVAALEAGPGAPVPSGRSSEQ
ncbi:MAG: hypothetical protein NUV77_10155 [Thermoguttaceae bacterium]|jgi:hypothetical protein|nr:hypothetical protein [Thermoguttaceae bacterium]